MLVGMIVGVGVFALPFAFAQAGFFVGLGFLGVLGVAITTLHLIYGEVTLRTQKSFYLVGYAEHYFGRAGKWIITGAVLFGLIGALLAYIIISGHFLETVGLAFTASALGQAFWLSIAFFVSASILSLWGVRRLAREELLLATVLVVVVLIISFDSLRFVNLQNLVTSNGQFFLPYGVVLFSLLGTSAIPEIRQMLVGANKGKSLRVVLLWGTIIPILLYALFSLAVVGVTGLTTTEEPFQGLAATVGARVIVLGSLFGFLAVMTSYLVLALNGIETLMQSYGFSRKIAWVVISGAPVTLFLLGVRDFINIVDFVGTVLTAVIGTAIILLWWRSRRDGDRDPEYSVPHPYGIGGVLIVLFVSALVIYFALL